MVRSAPGVVNDPQLEQVDLSVVIPSYNEAKRIERALARVSSYLEEHGGSWEVVVVDDGSSDQTALIVQRFIAGLSAPRVRLLRLGVNQGKGAALRAGVASTRGARVLMMDADLATPIEELAALERVLDGGAQVATGSRAVATSHIKRYQSPLRVLLGRAGNLWIRSLAVPGIHDTQCGFKLFEGESARKLFALCRENRFGIDIEVLCLAQRRLGLSVVEVGVAWEHQDGSKVKWKDYVDVFLRVPRIAWSVLRRPTD
ncbi:MAG TPA: dolichyl-phosphate beta-glucosyltransferase [Polyangia bacterium]|nr:dolichyl-phosphate beta-glucosyltransferase [Polyangia bacterium]